MLTKVHVVQAMVFPVVMYKLSMMKEKEESEKADLKLNIQKTKIMASGSITSWQICGEMVTDFILGDSRITADVDCSHDSGSW